MSEQEQILRETAAMDAEEEIAEEMINVDPEKQAKFREESKDRMNKIHQQIGYLEKIASKRTVDYTPEDVEKMFAYLENRLTSCKKAFMARFEEESFSDFDFDF